MSDPDLQQMRAARETFTQLVEDVRPELLRYCARMMGNTIDGEDVVQDTLARAFYDLARLQELPKLRAWLFRIAHNAAINALVARRRRSGTEADDVPMDEPAADTTFEQKETIGLAVGRFLELPSAQRATVVLKDVLDLSLEEIAEVLSMSVPAVKAALHRGRTRLRRAAETPAACPRAHRLELERYVALFNARDWDGVRALLASDARLELVGSATKEVGSYFSNYDKLSHWHAAATWMDGREVIAIRRDPTSVRPTYVVELCFVNGRIALIRDFVHARHVVDEATFSEL